MRWFLDYIPIELSHLVPQLKRLKVQMWYYYGNSRQCIVRTKRNRAFRGCLALVRYAHGQTDLSTRNVPKNRDLQCRAK